MNIIIGVDVDAVLRNWAKSFNDTYREVFPHYSHLLKNNREWVNIEGLKYDELGLKGFLKKYEKKIYLEAEILPNVQKTMEWLKQMSKDLGFKLIIISKQTLKLEKDCTYEWLKNNMLLCDTVVFTNNFQAKWKFADIIIDDSVDVLSSKPKTLNKISIKVSMPYNNKTESDFIIDSFGTLIPQDILNAIHKLG